MMPTLCGCCDREATHICRDHVADEFFCDKHQEECCERMEED
jgi:hypothetical protein